ncbi:DUF937 domain-containing protein [Rhizobium paknamense]|uniref:DUF937 domain-containing protein n=1 Tax=Rhizobium paknamense TaxID=1206817 RepID=A0ABU0I9P0_9HYPH|nr:DUF937 domain-containing protein [Rhizobium paknamense]MDQ0454945.1 hypothetical protein [Rhizobium paknamense]
MIPLFEMMLRAQNGAAVEAMAKQFGLAQEQAAQAFAALAPAFSSGLKRTAANPYDLSALFSAIYSGNYARYFEDLGKAFTPEGIADGNRVLEQLFGSKEVSRAIAAQAAQITGIGQDILKRMLPGVADTIMGGLFKQGMGQLSDTQNAFSGTPFGPMVEQWLQATGFQPKPKPKQPDPIFDNPFVKAWPFVNAWQDMAGIKTEPAAKTANPFLDNPFAKAWTDMVSASLGQAPKTPEPPKPEPQAEAKEAMRSMVNTMFDSGLEVQKSYQKSMEQIFETYMKGSKTQAEPEPVEPEGK